jgi:hypothetical protein
MRLIEGRDLHQVLAEGPLEPGRAVRIIDVEPSNALMTSDDFTRLIDFGTALDAASTGATNPARRISV